MQLIASQVLRARLVRRAAEEDAEVPDGADVGCLRLLRELADRHVLDHAPAQRADGLLGHGSAPVLRLRLDTPILRQLTPSLLPHAPALPPHTTARAV